MDKIKKNITADNIFFLIGLIALSAMIYKIGLGSIFENIKQTGWWFLPILAVWAIAYMFNTTSAMLIIRDGSPESYNIKFATLYKITISTFAYNAATPIGLAGGEPYKIMELKKYIGTTKATSSVILFSMMHFVSHFCFWMFSILLVIIYVPMQEGWLGLFATTFGICLLLIYLFSIGYRNGIVSNALNFFAKIPFIKNKIKKIKEEKKDEIELIDQQIAALHGERRWRFYLSLCIEFFSRIFTCSEIYFMFIAFGHPISYIDCILIMAFTSLFANVLFFTPLQLGTREGGFLLAFGGLGLTSSWAISISLITRIRETVWMMIGLLLTKTTIKDGSKLLKQTSDKAEEKPTIHF
ncbi:MAG: flippase-like domain-containing protein [Paludibacteraceae bacterium]|nr:flippase-like domain-containing protein [Paludibacteraceae bacterium]